MNENNTDELKRKEEKYIKKKSVRERGEESV